MTERYRKPAFYLAWAAVAVPALLGQPPSTPLGPARPLAPYPPQPLWGTALPKRAESAAAVAALGPSAPPSLSLVV